MKKFSGKCNGCSKQYRRVKDCSNSLKYAHMHPKCFKVDSEVGAAECRKVKSFGLYICVEGHMQMDLTVMIKMWMKSMKSTYQHLYLLMILHNI